MLTSIDEFITSHAHLIDVIIKTQFRPRRHGDYEEMYSCGLIALWKAYLNYNAYKSQLQTYIWLIVQREIVRHLKQKKKWYLCSDFDFAVNPKERLKDFLPNLPKRDKKIITMRIDGYTLKEIAQEIGCSIQVVHYHLKKIINILREVNDIT
jgi:RNA polymerase sigma factor (sigma-70 family)